MEELDRHPSPPISEESNIESEAIVSDAIGSTVYSKHFVLSTLVKLLDSEEQKGPEGIDMENGIELEPELEQAVCQLWDMSADSEVASFLLDIEDFMKIIAQIVNQTNKPRLTEVLMGLLANLCSDMKSLEKIYEDDILCELSLSILSCRDPPTLIQATRLINSVLNNDRWSEQWENTLNALDRCEDICFILASTVNEKLMVLCSQLVDSLLQCSESTKKVMSVNMTCIISALNQAIDIKNQTACAYLLHSLHSFTTESDSIHVFDSCRDDIKDVFLKFVHYITEIENVDIDQYHLNSLLAFVSVGQMFPDFVNSVSMVLELKKVTDLISKMDTENTDSYVLREQILQRLSQIIT